MRFGLLVRVVGLFDTFWDVCTFGNDRIIYNFVKSKYVIVEQGNIKIA